MTAAPPGKTPADPAPTGSVPPPRFPVGRAVIWAGLALGTAVTVLAVMHGIRFPGLEVVLSVVVTWLLLIVVAVTVTELLRRHHRAMARHTWRHSRRGVSFAARRTRRGAAVAGGYLTAKAAARWQARRAAGQPGEDAPFTPVLLTARSTSGRVLNPVTGEPVNTVLVKDPEDLKRRLAAAARYPDIEVSTRPVELPDGNDRNPPERKTTMADTTVIDDGTPEPAGRARARRRPATGVYSAEWKTIAGRTADFEPENDGHLLEWMAAEVAGMSAYAEALTEVYETCVSSMGLDPVAMQATHDVADAAADAASAMSAARAKFAGHYAEVREFAANGGLLPFNGRWITGDGDA